MRPCCLSACGEQAQVSTSLNEAAYNVSVINGTRTLGKTRAELHRLPDSAHMTSSAC